MRYRNPNVRKSAFEPDPPLPDIFVHRKEVMSKYREEVYKATHIAPDEPPKASERLHDTV